MIVVRTAFQCMSVETVELHASACIARAKSAIKLPRCSIDSIGTCYLTQRALFLQPYRGPIISINARPRSAPLVPNDPPSTCQVPGSPRCNRASHSTRLMGSSFTKLFPNSITHLPIGRERLSIAISITLWTIGFDRLACA